MSGHTPGPWSVKDVRGETRIYGNVEGGAVARVELTTPGGSEPDKANARLIASAPDLLAALKAANEYGRGEVYPWTAQARAAIARAEGGSK